MTKKAKGWLMMIPIILLIGVLYWHIFGWYLPIFIIVAGALGWWVINALELINYRD